MFLSTIKKSMIVLVSIASVAQARDGHGIGFAPGFGGDHHQLCDNPYDPNCQPGGGYNGGRPDRPHRPDRPGYNDGQTIVKSIYIGRSVRNERLNLRQLSGFGSELRGFEIVAIRGNTTPNSSSRTQVDLIADGRVVDTQTNPGYQIDLRPQRRLVIGSNVRDLEIYVTGSTFIDSIDIELSSGNSGGGYEPPRPPRPEPRPPRPPQYPDYPSHPGYPGYPGDNYGSQRVNININRYVTGNDRVDVLSYLNVDRYHGRRVEQVIVTARPQYNVALIEVLENSFNAGTLEFQGGYSNQQSVYLNDAVLGRTLGSLVLRTRGNMTIENVVLVLR